MVGVLISIWSVVGGSWSVVGGSWSVVGGSWSVVGGSWSVVCGLWSVVGGWSVGGDFVLRLFLIISQHHVFYRRIRKGLCSKTKHIVVHLKINISRKYI